MIQVNHVYKDFGEDYLLNNLNFTIKKNEKVAIIGENGAGKSTFLKILAGYDTTIDGNVTIPKNTTVGFLNQNFIEMDDNNLYDEVYGVQTELLELDRLVKKTLKEMETNHDEKILNRYFRLEEEYKEKGGFESEQKVKTILTKFNFNEEDFSKNVNSFSGGEKFKISFSKLLVQSPDILILDEPTNHLDIETIRWLELFLKNYQGTVVFVTHDRFFVDRVANKVIEIENTTVELYSGNYTYFLEEKQRRIESNLKEFKKQQKEIEHLEGFVTKFKGNAKKQGMVRSREKRLNKMEVIQMYKHTTKDIKINFESKKRSMGRLITANNLFLGYDDIFLEDISFEVDYRDKIALIGRNGTGKTSIVQAVLDNLEPLDGDILLNEDMKYSYLDQQLNVFDEDLSIFDAIHEAYPNLNRFEIQSLLGGFYFRGEEVNKLVRVLSGGEKVRLALLKLSIEPVDLLILDEPSNNLDLQTKEILGTALNEYDGTILCISHDRYFLSCFANRVFKVEDKQLIKEEVNTLSL